MQLQCNVVWKCSSLTLALPRTVKVTLAFSVHHRDGETMGNSTDSTTQWTWGSLFSSPVVATAYWAHDLRVVNTLKAAHLLAFSYKLIR